MKIRILTLFIMSAVFFTSCNDDNSNENTIEGIWHLKKIDANFGGIYDYTDGEVKWDFNFDNNTVTVENNIMTDGPESTYPGLFSGTYIFEIIENEQEEEILFVDNIEQGALLLLDNTLTIDEDSESDGFIRKFER